MEHPTDKATVDRPVQKTPYLPIAACRRPKHIGDFASSNEIINTKVRSLNLLKLAKEIKFCKPCNMTNSQCCRQVKRTNQLSGKITNKSF